MSDATATTTVALSDLPRAAAALVRRAHDLVPAHPALEPYRARLALAAADPAGEQPALRRLVRDLHRNRLESAAQHAGLALLVLAAFPEGAAH